MGAIVVHSFTARGVVIVPMDPQQQARLARAGFHEPELAHQLLEAWSPVGLDEFVADLADTADPDRALHQWVRLLEACSDPERQRVISTARAHPDFRRRLLDLLGISLALGDFLVVHPEVLDGLVESEKFTLPRDAGEVRARVLRAVGADPHTDEPVASADDALDALRRIYRIEQVDIATRDISGAVTLEHVGLWLADLADATLEAALAIARRALPEGSAPCRLAVIAMGKTGARELNYISDVDVIFVAEAPEGTDEAAALKTATHLASGLMRACSATTGEGAIWEVDAGLRPEGKQGALVRTLHSHSEYYQRWAKTWEFQALLKARCAAGDRELGARYEDMAATLVWSAADRPDFVSDVQAMRKRVEAHIPASVADRELKLGPGGLRDVEFSVQLLQLVHGRTDVMLRSPTTLTALESLATWGYVGRADASTLADAYRFLRTLEHRIQLRRMQRTHTMPTDPHDLRVLARSLGFRADPIAELEDHWKRHAREARRLHEKLFYRPLLNAVARLDAGEARLSVQAAQERLTALGFADPAGALTHLQALTTGVSRRAAIQRTLLPVMLGWFAAAPDPDAGLLGFRQVSDALGATPWYLRLLRDESVVAERMARVLSSSRYATELIVRAPESVMLFADDADLAPRSAEVLAAEVESIVSRQTDAASVVSSLRAMRRREVLRLAVSEVLTFADVDAVGTGLSATADAVMQGAVAAVQLEVDPDLTIDFSIIGMGRYGGYELGFGSDADVMFVYRAHQGVDEEQAGRTALTLANELRSLLMVPSTDPPLDIDADLRPEGKQGPLVRSLRSYGAYYERWSSPWESQALLRARHAAGSVELSAELQRIIDPLRYPVAGVHSDALREMRRLKARMESERLPRGVDSTRHVKLGRGGLSDVEWTVQLLQMMHAAQLPELRVTGTIEALEALTVADLIRTDDARDLRKAWELASTFRNAVVLARGRASDVIPHDVGELNAVAYMVGYGSGADLEQDYLRVTRRARRVVERLFYGET